MSDLDSEQLRLEVSKSGFPFQRRIAHLINSTSHQHGWSIESGEHAWIDSESAGAGFIDMVASHRTKTKFKLFIECKRPRGGRWIFLINKESTPEARLRTFWRYGHAPAYKGWDDLRFRPLSLESCECIVAGQKDKSPLLERLAGEILQSMVGVSNQEQIIFERAGRSSLRVYIPAIVTAAELIACRVDPATEISDDGVIAEGATFESVPYIRFRKSLAKELTHAAAPRNLQEENLDKERTILIVNSRHLLEALPKIGLIGPTEREAALDMWRWPWEVDARPAPPIRTNTAASRVRGRTTATS